MVSGKPDSLWPTPFALISTGLALAGLVLIAALADGDLAKWLSGGLIVLWALPALRSGPPSSQPNMPLAAILGPLFVAIVIAYAIADGEWFFVALFAGTLILTVLTRIALVLWWRRDSGGPRQAT